MRLGSVRWMAEKRLGKGRGDAGICELTIQDLFDICDYWGIQMVPRFHAEWICSIPRNVLWNGPSIPRRGLCLREGGVYLLRVPNERSVVVCKNGRRRKLPTVERKINRDNRMVEVP